MTEGKEPISLVEAKIAQGEQEARRLLHILEQAMVRCGYTRDGVYNSRLAHFTGKGRQTTVIYWKKGKIYHDSRLGTAHKIPVEKMNAYDLLRIAHNLAPFLDAMEGDARHLIHALQNACKTVEALIERINAEPRPSDNPAQMTEEKQ